MTAVSRWAATTLVVLGSCLVAVAAFLPRRPALPEPTSTGDGVARSVELPDAARRTAATRDALLGIDAFLTDNFRAKRGTVVVTPWHGERARKLEIGLGRRAVGGVLGDPDIELAPGAVVAWHSYTTRIVGIS